MSANNARILIVGTGAMACLFSARLAASSIAVTHLGTWAEGLEALRMKGVSLVGVDGFENNYPVKTTSDPQTCQGTRLALVLVKSWQTQRVAQQLSRCLHPQGLALTLQNGLGNDSVLAGVLGSERVALGVTTTGASLISPGKVRPVGDGMVTLGDHPRLKPLASLLSTAGFRIETVFNTTSLVWGKLVINAAINPLTALLKVTNGELLERTETRELMEKIALEAAAVAAASRISLPYVDPVEAVQSVARRTESNTSSMLSDVLQGRPTEIDAINGAVVRQGDHAGVPTQINRTMWQLVCSLEGQQSVRLSRTIP